MKNCFLRIITRAPLLVLLLMLSLIFSSCAGAQTKDIEAELKKTEASYRRTKKEIEELDRKIRETKRKEITYVSQIDKLSRQAHLTEKRISVTSLKKSQVLAKMSDLSSQIKNANGRIDYIKDLLEDRLVAIYKYGNVAEFNLFLSAPGAKDAMATSYLLGKIAAEDQKLIEELTTHKAKLDSIHKELASQKKNLEIQNKELSSHRAALARDQQTRTVYLQKVRSEKQAFIDQQKELQQASLELQNTIGNLLEKKRKALAAQRGGKEEIYYRGGKLAWPLKGAITSPYGSRIHPVFKTRANHTGIDIDGNTGDPVRAANDGEVLYSGWLRGYGQVVIIDHGGSLTTVYAHLSKISVGESAKVKRGDIIGRVGATGVATGPHLHFEVRVNGGTANPMKYL